MHLMAVMKRVVPLCFLTGASMELFMIKTGFYEIVTRKEAERQLEKWIKDEDRKQKLRLAEASISLPSGDAL